MFFDEIDSLSPTCQIKLLRFLQDKQYRRLGENRLRRADVRVLAATNADLQSCIERREFRQDLFFRLRVVPIEVPALSDRPEDIAALLESFTKKASEKYGLPPITFDRAAIDRLVTYDWPGNIRELENTVAYLTCLQFERPVGPGDLPLLRRDDGGEDLVGGVIEHRCGGIKYLSGCEGASR